jgi:hypothetical protein
MTTHADATTETASLPPGWTQLAMGQWTKDDGRRTIAVVLKNGDRITAWAWAREERWGEPETYRGDGFADPGLAIAAVEHHLAT